MTDKEAQGKLLARRSLHLTRAVRRGERLTEDLVDWRRPGTGIRPAELGYALGRAFGRDLPGGTRLTWSDLA
jgi:sialic acid synthase SpsE